MSERANKPARSRRSLGSSVWPFSILLAVASLFGCGGRSEKHPKDVVQWIKDCNGSIGYYDAELGSSDLTNFEKVTVRDRSINDVSPLANLTRLTSLNRRGTHVSDSSVDILRKTLLNCDIRLD